MTLGDAKYSTHSVDKTLNPEWNVRCQLPIVGPQSLLLDVIAWDKDKFGKDYLGEFDLALEEIFANGQSDQEPKWYPLKSKRPGKKTSVVSGEVQLQFTLFDNSNKDAIDQDIFDKLAAITGFDMSTPTATPAAAPDEGLILEDMDDEDEDESPEGEEEGSPRPEIFDKRRKRLRLKGLKRKRRQRAYEFTNGGSDVVGVIFLEICRINDLPPESNLTRTSFDMDPFVVATLGKKTYRTKRIRHNLNPVYNEKMIFQVYSHEQSYSFGFTVIDHDKYSGNDFIASANLPVKELIDRAPSADPETGLYNVQEPAEYIPASRSKLLRLGLSRSTSSQSLSSKFSSRPGLGRSASSAAGNASMPSATATPTAEIVGETATSPGLAPPTENPVVAAGAAAGETTEDDPAFNPYSIPLKMKNLDKWEDRHNPVLYVRAKYMPYPALRQQFWRAMLKQFDNDESGCISKVELTTMLDTLGSTLRESTIDSFFERFPHKATNGEEHGDLTMNEAVICLEDQLQKTRSQQNFSDKAKELMPDSEKTNHLKNDEPSSTSEVSQVATITVPELNTPGEEGEIVNQTDDLAEDRTVEEHVVEIKNCPICHQPRLNKRKDSDIITHIATCASQDWRQVNELMMGGFVTASQAQRKWYSKVITKISYGGYKLGANSANILVQDRITGQINEEKMSVYVRLGIRLLYKGLKSNSMENRRSK